MGHGVANNVRRVDVCELVDDLAAAMTRLDEPRAPEHTEMLAHQRLWRADRVDQLVDAVRVIGEEIDDGQPDRSRNRSEEGARGAVPIQINLRHGEGGPRGDRPPSRPLLCTYAP